MTTEVSPISITGPDGTVRYGLHVGALTPVDLRRVPDRRHARRLWRSTHHKRWMFATIAGEHFQVAVAIVHLGYAATAFAYVLDRRTRSMLFDRSYTGLPIACSVSDGCEEGAEARFRAPFASMAIERGQASGVYTLQVHAHDLRLRASLDASTAPPPITAIAPVTDGSIHVTEKRVLMPVRGQLFVGDRFIRLDESVAGLDYTQGFLARRTEWRWAFCMGRSTDGRAVGFNLVEGLNGSRECAVWLEGQVVPVNEPTFQFEPDRPLAPWRIATAEPAIDIRFRPDAVHTENRNLGLIRSHFVQPAGAFSGLIELPGHKPVTLDGSPGMVEHQDVLW